VRGRAIEGAVRFGLPADFAEAWLPTALGRFKRAHPAIRIEAIVDRNRRLLERLDRGELDLVLALDNQTRSDAEPIASLPLVWIGPASAEQVWTSGEPIPLAMYEPPCFFRQRALAALDHAGLAWRISFSSSSLRGLWSAVEAGLGVTLRTDVGLPAGVRVLGHVAALPPAPKTALALCLHDGKRPLQPALNRLRSIIVETLESNLPLQRGRGSARPKSSLQAS
jgi:DNA-binding transcriptional LysR family regulator